MKAVLLEAKPASRDIIIDHLRIKEDAKIPEIKNDEVLVRVEATALNVEDIMIACGWRFGTALTATKEKPLVLGQEFSGTVAKVGSKVEGWSVGDQVLAHKLPLRVRDGSWAEFVNIKHSELVRKPESYSWAAAAAVPMQCKVAWGAVMDAGFSKLPVMDSLPHKTLDPATVETVVDGDNKALTMLSGTDMDKINEAKVAVVGASSTTGLMVVDMLVSR